MADYWIQHKPGLLSAFRSIKQQAVTMGAMRYHGSDHVGPPEVIIYPSYAYVDDNHPDRAYCITIRGWLFAEGDPNKRRNKLIMATTERFVGTQSTTSTAHFEQEIINLHEDTSSSAAGSASTSDRESTITRESSPAPPTPTLKVHPPSASDNSSRSRSRSPVPGSDPPQHSKVVRQRMAPFFRKSLSLLPIDIDIFGRNGEYERFLVDSDSGGRFEHTFHLPFVPYKIGASFQEAHDTMSPFFINPRGVSVISDVDDTVRLTGILKGKRDTLRNVLAAPYSRVKLDGVADWYRRMQSRGASFHYVSNSPWQMYDCVSEFLKSQEFPRGSMHLKRYQGFIDGIFEPVAHRKVKTLYRIFDDFPKRKFILIGDGGELDLETYVQVAQSHPNQVLAIFIRDLILPEDESLEVEDPFLRRAATSHSASSSCSTEDLIDMGPHKPSKDTKPGRPGMRRFNSKSIIQGLKDVAPRTPTKGKHKRNASQPQPPPHFNVHQARAELHQTTVGGVAGALLGTSSHPGAAFEAAHMMHEHLRPTPPDFVSSSQDYSEYERLDKERKRIDSWKARIIEARRCLPAGVELKLWRHPREVENEALRKIGGDNQLL